MNYEFGEEVEVLFDKWEPARYCGLATGVEYKPEAYFFCEARGKVFRFKDVEVRKKKRKHTFTVQDWVKIENGLAIGVQTLAVGQTLPSLWSKLGEPYEKVITL
jgi:hypothetical protein